MTAMEALLARCNINQISTKRQMTTTNDPS